MIVNVLVFDLLLFLCLILISVNECCYRMHGCICLECVDVYLCVGRTTCVYGHECLNECKGVNEYVCEQLYACYVSAAATLFCVLTLSLLIFLTIYYDSFI
uniref:Uncharacterized protein n=1 Tax=Cacopsylla melanoneura TaxID=428564 RepID=A0A8D8X8X4_9HEMI